MILRRTYLLSLVIIAMGVIFARCNLPCIDGDGDGFGNPASFSCPVFLLDCDDSDPAINPGAPDIMGGDGIDNNCNGMVDEMDVATCMQLKCMNELTMCLGDPTCAEALLCTSGCVTEPEPERCQIECTVSNYSPLLDLVMACTFEKGCFPEPTYDCPIPPDATSLADIDVSDLEGDWFVVRGLSNTYDCWDCQRYRFSATSATTADYVYLYTVSSGASSEVPAATIARLNDST